MNGELMASSNLMNVLLGVILITAFIVMGYSRIMPAVNAFALQSAALAGLACLVAYYTGTGDIYVIAVLTLMLKVWIIPRILKRIIRELDIRREIEPIISIPSSLLASTALVVLSYSVVQGIDGITDAFYRNALSISLSVLLIGFLIMISRKKAITQMIGLLIMENGLFLAGICLTYGMPLIVELGIFFDVLMAVLILGVLSNRINRTFDSVDVDKLTELRG